MTDHPITRPAATIGRASLEETQVDWVYWLSEPGLWTVGYYDHLFVRHTDSDHTSEDSAGARVHYLNGGTDEDLEQRVRRLEIAFESLCDMVSLLRAAHLGHDVTIL